MAQDSRINTMQLAHISRGNVLLYEYVDAKAAEEYVNRLMETEPDAAQELDILYTTARVYRVPVIKETMSGKLTIDTSMIDTPIPFNELHPPAWDTAIEAGAYVAVAVISENNRNRMIPAGELPRYMDDEYTAPPFGKGFR